MEDVRRTSGEAQKAHGRHVAIFLCPKHHRKPYLYGGTCLRQANEGPQPAGLTTSGAGHCFRGHLEHPQQVLRSNRINAPRNSRTPFLLRGLIKCGVCGLTFCGMRASPRQPDHYYHCNGRYVSRGSTDSRARSARRKASMADTWRVSSGRTLNRSSGIPARLWNGSGNGCRSATRNASVADGVGAVSRTAGGEDCRAGTDAWAVPPWPH